MAISTELRTHKDLCLYIQSCEPYYVGLMRGGRKDTSLQEASHLLCATLTALMAFELLQSFPSTGIFLLQGVGKHLTEAGGHDVLGISLRDSQVQYSYVDGTVFQLFPDEKHIRVGEPSPTLDRLLESLEASYRGTWTVRLFPSSQLTQKSADQNKRLIQLHAQRK